MIKSYSFFFLFLYILTVTFLLYFGILSESKVFAQDLSPKKPANLPDGPKGTESTKSDPAKSTQKTSTTTNQTKQLNELLNSFIGNPEYDVINLPYLLDVYLNNTVFSNLKVECIKTLPVLASMKIELTPIDCEDIFIFFKLNSTQINSDFFEYNYNKELAMKMNLYYKIKFLPQLIKDISKSEDIYCLEWGNSQFKFDLDLLNCNKFSLLLSPKR